ncbi:MAG TPA: GntR family transcriptional regulator [Symbiobacteriaceae bacterium]|jgi:GntR family transcriptional regulator|nr:GntR family transcriptional regulator [Symbiobacteriaceae bacterium]
MLDPVSPLPLYAQLMAALQREIEQGNFPVGEAIPPERELITRYGVSRITVRQALAGLVADGYLIRRHGKGTYVAPRKRGAISESLSELTGHLEELQRQGLDPQVEVLVLDRRPLSAEIADALCRPVGAAGWFLHRKVSVGGAPLMLSEVWLPGDLGIELTGEMLRRSGMAQLLTEHGRVPASGTQRIGAQLAGADTAALLAVPPGEALLRVVRVITGADGLPLVWFRTLYRADRYEYEVELKRRR